ncbi:hypothetical protein CpB0236 [Chlamydia pneumoniae TW-183]|uniref:Uncharacterized protein n=3 Tax=Chlamydia pneumoniae TaxID=83558 RepID=A0A0F7XSQ2_CHLPN|nr:hypothetical protein [Chlamydia pneumoniae]AAD18383.1 CT179 hypothetical protein [Chlamydia pneumoniae CWL029]AAP98169.1 hypothetical protein CpB0236 [Chlamydia pneumoniae TW-183]CRI32729.1 Uncharacterized protein BN1224_Wien1_A_02360 [Chlamydia pneumoniae]CRI35592.1 Uncharacterized protein BN1224_CM1_A_02390 [Chlamydia pneumoniae]CRI36718.1 Uncharacterized protein BN1224_CV14_A_02370 [Chlamydia pneumoniae]
MSSQPLVTTSSSLSRYVVLTGEEKVACYKKAFNHIWHGAPAIILAAALLMFCIFGFVLGSILLGAPLEGASILYDVILPWLLPSILVFVLLVLPLNIYAYSHHKQVLALHERITQSNYKEIYDHCEKEKKTPNKKALSLYIESQVLVPEYSKRFSSMILGKTLKIIPKKDSPESLKHDELIQKALERAKENIYMNKNQREKRDEREAKKEAKNASKTNPLWEGLGT